MFWLKCTPAQRIFIATFLFGDDVRICTALRPSDFKYKTARFWGAALREHCSRQIADTTPVGSFILYNPELSAFKNTNLNTYAIATM